jgi:LysR family hydrogen peroxide-inducible transcriptional activator
MHAKNLGFRDLQYAIAVADCGSISRAAEACGITQPALSERIKRIENTLGVELFERSNRRIRITPVGERLILKARSLMDEVAEMDEIISSSNVPLSGQLRVGVISSLGPYLMPLVLPRLKKKYPSLELILHEGLTDQLVPAVLSGTLDLVVASAPLHWSGLRIVKLFDEPFILAIPKEHPFAEKTKIKASELIGADMVLLEDGHCLTGQALDVCPAKQRRNQSRLQASTLETLRHMVATGAGYTLLPYLAVGAKPALRNLIRYTKLDGKQYSRSVVMACRESFSRQEDAKLLAELIVGCLPKEVRIYRSM